MRYPAILFDLFRTVVLFTPEAPTGQVNEPNWRSAMGLLRPLAAELLPGVSFDDFLDALVAASREIARERHPEHREVPIAERYGRALARLGISANDSRPAAERLAAAQLEAQLDGSTVPAAHRELLEELSRSHRLALVSNFDHAPTVARLLEREGLTRLFSAVVISIEVGRRKPHPEIFAEALRRLNAKPGEAVFVGDSPGDDVAGARNAGIDAAWLNVGGEEKYPAGLPEPTFVLSRLTDLRRVLHDPLTQTLSPRALRGEGSRERSVVVLNVAEHAAWIEEKTRGLPVSIRHASYELPWAVIAGRRAGFIGSSPPPGPELKEMLAGAEVLFAFALPLGTADLAPRLRWVETAAAGYDQLNGTGILEKDVAVTTVGSVFAPLVAEHVFALLFSLWRRLGEFHDAQREKEWKLRPVRELSGATMAIVGFGRIGSAVARAAKAFGMRVLATRRRIAEPSPGADRVYPREELRAMLAEADVVVLAVEGTPETAGMIGTAELAAMKCDACLVNVARGIVVDEKALIEALAERHIGGAALDVFVQEPLPPESPLWRLPNVVITPHAAVNLAEKFRRPLEHFADNLARYCAGEPLVDQVK
jgi:HAD superfamily hydrolase (TIGR01509 family)